MFFFFLIFLVLKNLKALAVAEISKLNLWFSLPWMVVQMKHRKIGKAWHHGKCFWNTVSMLCSFSPMPLEVVPTTLWREEWHHFQRTPLGWFSHSIHMQLTWMRQMKLLVLTWRKRTLKVRMFYGTFPRFPSENSLEGSCVYFNQ